MSDKTKLSEMTVFDLVTLVVQIAVVLASVILFAVNGDTSALLGLGALAGGAKGAIFRDLAKALAPKGKMLLVIMAVVGASFLCQSCGTMLSTEYVLKSQGAVTKVAGNYFEGCRQFTIAPLFSVEWEGEVLFGGGVMLGCEANGELLEFKCLSVVDEQGQKAVKCEPIQTWMREIED